MSVESSKETEESFTEKIHMIDENFVVLNFTTKEVLCKVCYIKYTYYSDIHLRLHILSQEHLHNVEKNKAALEKSEFETDLALALSSADISLDCLKHPVFKAFLEKYCNKEIPEDLSSMSEKYAGLFDKEDENKSNKNICLSCNDLSSDES